MTRGDRWAVVFCCVVGLSTVLTPSLAGQASAWRVTGAGSQSWFSGGVKDTSYAGLEYQLRPTVAWSVGADHSLGKLRLGAGVSYLSTNFQAVGADLTLVDEAFSFRQWGVTALVTVPVLRVGNQGAGLSLAAGPALGFWSVTGADSRTTLGGVAALQFTAPITPGWDLLAIASGSASGSPFQAVEMPPDFERTTLWSWQVGLGLRYLP